MPKYIIGSVVRVNNGRWPHTVLCVFGDWLWLLRNDDTVIPQTVNVKFVTPWED